MKKLILNKKIQILKKKKKKQSEFRSQKLPEYKMEYLIYFIFFEYRIWHPTNMTCFTRSHQIQTSSAPISSGPESSPCS